VLSAGGIVVQPLPGCPEETISHLELIAPTLGDISRRLLDEGPDGVIQSTFRGMDPQRIGEMPVELKCDCNRDRIERALISLGAAELGEMIEQDGGAEVRCHFCTQAYDFTAEELGALRDQAAYGSEGE
jgi:molecular chaperone Hsp33